MTTCGAGGRGCVGQEVATKESYLAMVMLIDNYVFKIPSIYKDKKEYKIPRKFLSISHVPALGVSVTKRN